MCRKCGHFVPVLGFSHSTSFDSGQRALIQLLPIKCSIAYLLSKLGGGLQDGLVLENLLLSNNRRRCGPP